ncbi:MAG: SRPBCC family protein, partial [Actinomycetes bacterium]
MTEESTNTRVSLNVDIAVPVSVAYAAVSDPRKYGRWSPEATGAQLPSGGLLKVGDRFTGRSRVWVQWSGNCIVVAAEPDKRFAFEVSIAGIRVSGWT